MNKKERLSEDTIIQATDFFKIMGDNTRLKILLCLIHQELCVNDIAEAIDMSQSSVSHQLKTLRISKLVKSRRDGKMIYYSLDDDHVTTILDMTIEHLREK